MIQVMIRKNWEKKTMKRVKSRGIEIDRNARFEARVEFARMLNNALVEGQIPRGVGVKWTNQGFADRLGEIAPKDPSYSEANVRGWHKVNDPGNPDKEVIHTILDALYGDSPELRQRRDRMLALWQRANGLVSPTQIIDDPRGSNTGSFIDDLLDFTVRAEQDASGAEIWDLLAELVISISEANDVDLDGRHFSLSVGLTRATLRVASGSHEIVEGTMAGRSGRTNPNLGVRASGLRVQGPLAECGRIDGEPLADRRLVSLRRRNDDGASARVVLETDRAAFKVIDNASKAEITDENKVAVLRALLANKFEADTATIPLARRDLDLIPGAR